MWPMSKYLLPVFFYEYYITFKGLNPFLVNYDTWYNSGPLLSFYMWLSNFPNTFIEETILSSLHILGSFVIS